MTEHPKSAERPAKRDAPTVIHVIQTGPAKTAATLVRTVLIAAKTAGIAVKIVAIGAKRAVLILIAKTFKHAVVKLSAGPFA